MQKVKIVTADEAEINRWLAEDVRRKVIETRPLTYGNGDTAVLIRYESLYEE